ncbi:hypothetical protein GWI33_012010 [Rhynchophorus ferrugineus]|uniref:Uncharacterized protein n=1 Tax=Rhynchophorus ferrugineus TaxID=354439 RepID=A0A834IPW3_RHYFE|nr:hypothetical protein GWI33_012010 [Rhynchophorus ferrugineus]
MFSFINGNVDIRNDFLLVKKRRTSIDGRRDRRKGKNANRIVNQGSVCTTMASSDSLWGEIATKLAENELKTVFRKIYWFVFVCRRCNLVVSLSAGAKPWGDSFVDRVVRDMDVGKVDGNIKIDGNRL